jgi:hypothetical protein
MIFRLHKNWDKFFCLRVENPRRILPALIFAVQSSLGWQYVVKLY